MGNCQVHRHHLKGRKEEYTGSPREEIISSIRHGLGIGNSNDRRHPITSDIPVNVTINVITLTDMNDTKPNFLLLSVLISHGQDVGKKFESAASLGWKKLQQHYR